jgi:hypothetical protein
MKAAARILGEAEEDEEDEEDDGEDESPVENDDDEETEDEADDEDDEDDEDAHRPAVVTAAPKADWLPDWAPYAVLAGLVGASIVFGLGLIGGSSASANEGEEQAAPAASALRKAPVKPSSHP